MPSPTTQRPIAGLLLVVTSSVGDHNKYLSNGCVVFGHSVNTELSILDDVCTTSEAIETVNNVLRD
jgi:hypothetical protein